MTQVPGYILLLALAAGGAQAEPAHLADLVAAAREADIVILGEVPDNPEHHRAQVAIVEALRPGALVFEMIPKALEDEMNRLRGEGGTWADLAAPMGWADISWPGFAHYIRIMEAAPGARIFGGSEPAGEVWRAVMEGAATVFGPDAASYGLDQPLPEAERAARETDLLATYCDAIPAEKLAGLVEAQRLHDAAIADAARWARTTAGDGPVVVISGNFPAHRQHGVPARIAAADPALRVLAVGQFETAPDAEQVAAYDAYLVAPYPRHADPCARLDVPVAK